MSGFIILIGAWVSVNTVIHYRRARGEVKVPFSNVLALMGIGLFFVVTGLWELLR
jgi:hypothetical protein